jgi:hypothetical protein
LKLSQYPFSDRITGRNSPDDEQVGQGINHIRRVELSLHPDRRAFAAELIDDVQRSVGTPIFCSVMHEVVRPDMVNMPGPETDARSVIEPEPAFPRPLHGNLQPLTTPQALDPLVVSLPSLILRSLKYTMDQFNGGGSVVYPLTGEILVMRRAPSRGASGQPSEQTK